MEKDSITKEIKSKYGFIPENEDSLKESMKGRGESGVWINPSGRAQECYFKTTNIGKKKLKIVFICRGSEPPRIPKITSEK